MMGFLIPSALALSALAIPIIIFYMLKLRREPARVSSLLLWQQVLQDRQANAPWQRLKRNLLLLLQLLILALLVMALARPYFTVQARVQGNVVLLLDASASMQATDVAPNRFAAAQQSAQELIDRLNPTDAVTLISVERTPRVLASATTDRAALRQALAEVQPASSAADWEAALTLAAGSAATLPDTTVVVLSDGAFTLDTNRLTFNAPLQFIPIGQSANNQGLVALSLRDGPAGPQLFLRVANAAPEPARRLVEIYADGRLLDARQVELPAQDSLGLTVSDLPLATQQVEARLTGQDTLPADDAAWVVRSAAPAPVLVVGQGNLFLERALALLPGLEPQRATPDQTLPQTQFDLVIFDRTTPSTSTTATGETLPQGNLLFIAPPASTGLFEVKGLITQTRLARLEARHPLLTYVKLDQLHVARAQAVTPPPWAQTLVEAEGGPLLIAGQTEGRRIAILTFDLHQSDLPLQIDFPILVANLTRWLLPGANLEQGQTLPAGQTFALPVAPTASAFLVKTPNGEEISLPLDPAAPKPGFNQTTELGIYQVFAEEPGQPEPVLLTEFAVNLLDETETNIQPEQAASMFGLELAPAAVEPATLTGRWEWWWLLALLGLPVLLLEWWIYWRGEVR